MSFIELHTHSEYSNLRLIDSTNKLKETINHCASLGLRGMALCDHECLSGHIKALNYAKKVRETNPDFQIILGNEIYLCHDTEPWVGEDGKTRYTIESPEFFHFILLAKDAEGHKQLRELSTRAWSHCYSYKKMHRVPTFYSDIEAVIGAAPGHVVASTACLGGEFPKLVLKGDVESCQRFVGWCQQQFGEDNFFIELQPALSEDQINFNRRAIQFCKHFGLRWIITNDVHYLTKEKRRLHELFLQSHEEERELGDFYESTYFKTCDEMRERMSYLDKEDIERGFENTLIIGDMCKDAGDYGLLHGTAVPQRILPSPPSVKGIFEKWYDRCPSVKYLATSPYEQDRLFLQECEKGIIEKHIEVTDEVVERIDIEAQQLLGISEKLGCRLTSYYNLMQRLEEIIWDVSIIGPGRGSACCLYCAYLMNITQIDSLKEDLPYWRHTHVSKVSLPDIDIDLLPSKRPQIFEMLKNEFGQNHCLNIITFKTETLKSAIKTAARGIGLDADAAQEMSNLVPVSRGKVWTYKECLEGNADNGFQPIRELVNLIQRYDGLGEVVQEIEGLITARGAHASGFYIMDRPYVECNSLMKTPSGMDCTCWEMEDSDAAGALKFDLLVTDAVEKIQAAMEMLCADEYMVWQDSLKATYDKYLHPDVLNYTDEKMWDYVGAGAIVDLFQFMSDIGIEAIKKIKPRSYKELAVASSLMRLMGDDPPIDRYVKFRDNIELWYQEMHDAGLNDDEVEILKKHLGQYYSCSVHQEDIMLLSMDEHISGFDMSQADALRSVIGKKKFEKIPAMKKLFYEQGKERGTRKTMLDYVWTKGFLPQLGYSFNKPHVLAYATIAIQEMNLFTLYPHIYWQTACLTVNASANEDAESSGGTNYGKTAKAISEMQRQGVVIALPAINQAKFGFRPDAENDRIIFGLKAISGVGDADATQIIARRSYTSFEDFLTRNTDLGRTTIIALIKGGCFDELCAPTPRQEIMESYVLWQARRENPPKESLNMQNFKSILALKLLPEQFDFQRRLNEFRSYIYSSGKVLNKDVFSLDNGGIIYFENVLCKFFENRDGDYFYTYTVGKTKKQAELPLLSYTDDGLPVIHKKGFEKFYDAQMTELAEWVKLPSTVEAYNQATVQQCARAMWEKYCTGTIPKWEMDSLSFYYTEHELDHVNMAQYSLSNFSEIPEEPVKIDTMTRKTTNRATGETTETSWDKYQLFRIAGTVLDKNKMRHSISLLTTDGVVNVKFYSGAFAHYDKQISEKVDGTDKKTVLEKSWFARGNKLLITGIRRGDVFFPKKYFDSIYQHTVCLITDVYSNGGLELQLERVTERVTDK